MIHHPWNSATRRRRKDWKRSQQSTQRHSGMNGQNVVLKADRNLFSQMILLAESISVNMKDVLAHPLGSLPWTLANADASLRKTNKAWECISCRSYPNPSTCIIDGMGLVQRMNGNNKIFAQLAESVLSMVLYVGVQNGRIDVVFDAYRQPSIIYSERLNRGASLS